MDRASKIVCVGKNYLMHAKEMGGEVPPYPLLFLKPPSSLLANGEPIVLPHGVGRIEYEGEIGIVIGRRARHLRTEDAWAAVAGIVPLNDVTARELQRKDNQWSRAKGFDTFCPVGTMVPTAGLDLDGLEVVTRVNGQVKQHGHARDMAFSIPFLLAWVSRIYTLEVGDILATGTPEGVGPLQPGDEVEVEVPGVGSVKSPVVAEDISLLAPLPGPLGETAAAV